MARRWYIDGEPALTRIQAGDVLGVSRKTIERWAEGGRIPAYACARDGDGPRAAWLYLESAIRALRADAEAEAR